MFKVGQVWKCVHQMSVFDHDSPRNWRIGERRTVYRLDGWSRPAFTGDTYSYETATIHRHCVLVVFELYLEQVEADVV